MKYTLIKIITLSSLFYGLSALSTDAVASDKAQQANEISALKAPNDEHDHTHQQSNKASKPADHDSTNKSDGGHDKGISFSPQKMALANIKVSILRAKIYERGVYAPGEIKANGYTSYIVSPRTESVIISRHATLGEHVEQGQALVTLFSESMADAQANYRVAYSEWQRAKKLGKSTVSESRLLKSETDYNAAKARLTAFGLTKQAINKISANKLSNLGEYTLVAQRSGAVLNDDFLQGQRVSPGDKIMVLANEDTLWVEARVSPNKKLNLPVGTPATLSFSGQQYDAKVIQEAHTIDPITRTRIIRLLVENKDDSLHSGMFVDVNFRFHTQTPVMAVPETALMRGADGDWTVFVEDHPGEFTAVEVELGQSLGDYRQIIGIEPNTRVVIEGAFFVASEIAKGGFDPHNH